MSRGELTTNDPPGAPGGRPTWRRWPVETLDRAVGARIREGRLRDVDWPAGLSVVVAVGCGLIVLSAVLALTSGWLRAAGDLVVPSTLNSSVPGGTVWLLAVMVVAALALGQTAALHGPWWLGVLATLVSCLTMAQFGLRSSLAANLLAPATVGTLIVGLIVFTVVRARRRFAWWEFPVVFALIGGGLAIGIADLARGTRRLGFELVPTMVQEAVVTLMVLVLPAAVAAGSAVAELTVGLTIAAAAQVERLPGRRWPYVLLGGLGLLLIGELGWRIGHLDPVVQGRLAFLPAVVVLGLLFAVCGGLLRLSARSTAGVRVSTLPDELGRVALPVAAVLVGLALPLLLVVTGLAVVVSVAPLSPLGRADLDTGILVSEGTGVVRLGLAVALAAIAVRSARRGSPGRAVVLGGVAVSLVAHSLRVLTGQRWAVSFDPEVLGILVGIGVLVLLGWFALRRRLSGRRAVAGSALIVLTLLYSMRQVLDDPVGALIGYSGVGLVLVGLVWDFLTGSSWANGESRRFPRPTRVLLVLTNSGLLAVVVAYAALVRDASGQYDPNSFAELGDLILGTGLLAAAFAVVVSVFLRDERIT